MQGGTFEANRVGEDPDHNVRLDVGGAAGTRKVRDLNGDIGRGWRRSGYRRSR